MDNKKITGECCGRPMQYSTEPKCNYNDCCMGEYCGCKLGRIKEMEPTCDSTAVIPSITVQSVDGITNLSNCLVHVEDTNTTYYVDDKHRVMITWAGPVDIPGYDMENNPNGYRDQIVTDIESETAVIYDKHGNGFLFGITKDNLQEAIDNKLDEMAADGTLENIIASYITDVAHVFNTVADMKLATNLVDGTYAQTLGFYSLNDGGGALYYITGTGTANDMDVIAIGSSLYANLIYGKEINVLQLGAYGDDTHDDSSIINYALTLVNVVNLPSNTYLCNSSIILAGNKYFTCKGTIHSTDEYALTLTNRLNNIDIHTLTGDTTNNAVLITNDNANTSTNNCNFNSIANFVDGLILSGKDNKGVMYNNIHFNYIKCSRYCIHLIGDNLTDAYVSENNFYGGRLVGDTGVVMTKGSAQTNPFAYNKFVHIGFEGLACDANLQLAVRNLFVECRTSEGVSGPYAFVLDADSRDNLFDCSYLEITKINDVNNVDRAFNTYKANRLTINGTAYASEMRVYKGYKIFESKWFYTQYQPEVSLVDQTNGTVSADYYYNGMIIKCGGTTASTDYTVNLNAAFDACGVTDFYLYVNKTSDSVLRVKDASGTIIIKPSSFSGEITNKLYHIVKTDRVSNSYSNGWSVVGTSL